MWYDLRPGTSKKLFAALWSFIDLSRLFPPGQNHFKQLFLTLGLTWLKGQELDLTFYKGIKSTYSSGAVDTSVRVICWGAPFFSILFLFVCFAVLYSHWDQLNRVTLFSRRRRREYWRIVTETNLVEVTIRRYCFGIITLMLIRENKIKKRHVFERFWGFKMSVEGGSDRQQAGFLIIAAVGFAHGNVIFCQTFINSSSSMFSISFVNSWCCWNHSVEQNIWQKLLDVPALRSKKV